LHSALFLFFHDPATPDLYTLSLHDALPISPAAGDLDQAYHSMYNLEFSAAMQQLQRWERDHPADPLGPVSEAASYLFSELNRLGDRKSTRLNSSHLGISYAVFCLKKKKTNE